jgi:glycosyltransferase involved in cell wall biosynthesis
MTKVRVLIDARVGVGLGGGVETLVRGLAKGYAEKASEKFEIIFLVNPGSSKLISEQDPDGKLQIFESNINLRKHLIVKKIRSFLRLIKYFFKIPISNRFTMQRDEVSEKFNPSIIHYTYQATFYTDIPYVYHPHDLQHKYFPSNFSILARVFRDANYSLMCKQASAIAVSSNWVKDDLINFYNLPADKIAVIPLAPLIDVSTESKSISVQKKEIVKGSEPTFLFYPAVNWPHKNHTNLFRAVKICQEAGVNVRVVCSGRILNRFPDPNETAESLGISSNVVTLGHVGQELLFLLYEYARAVIIPTMFEAASFPIYEAQSKKKAVACSFVTSLPEQVGDSAVLFDPDDPAQIAQVIRELWLNDNLILELETLSKKNIANISWKYTSEKFYSLYTTVLSNR